MLTDDDEAFLGELVLGNLEVQRRGPLPDPARAVVVRAVARAIVAAERAGVGDGDAAQVGAHAQDHQPLGIFHTIAVGLRVPQGIGVDGDLSLDLSRSPVSDE